MATYKELVAHAQKLMRQAEGARKKEIATLVGEIRARMAEYGISTRDLAGVSKKKSARKGARVAAKYRHPKTGETWAGRGRVPKWLAAEIAKGKKKEDFQIAAAK